MRVGIRDIVKFTKFLMISLGVWVWTGVKFYNFPMLEQSFIKLSCYSVCDSFVTQATGCEKYA